jgi:hypothetical protein
MRRNSGRPCVSGHVVADLVSATTARLVLRHPLAAKKVVDSVVYEAAAELVGMVANSEQLSLLLNRRAHARLTAMTGSPIAITGGRSLHP